MFNAGIFNNAVFNISEQPAVVIARNGGSSGKAKNRPRYWWEKELEQETRITRPVVVLPDPRVPLNPVIKEPLPFTPRAQFEATPDLGEPEEEKRARIQKRKRRAVIAAAVVASLYE